MTREWRPVNLNDPVRFKLTNYGREQLEIFYNNLFSYYPPDQRAGVVQSSLSLWQPKDDGYTRQQLWMFIDTFGQCIHIGRAAVIEHNNLEVLDES